LHEILDEVAKARERINGSVSDCLCACAKRHGGMLRILKFPVHALVQHFLKISV
jgi:hypothetical protein